ncbi:MAG: 2-oxo acid dehydrogenase subunit E2 [Proteobacteria bacterium]|nr:2-oxo acid dehydrogenase subunit E2 [Pseudomonadota bacterium]
MAAPATLLMPKLGLTMTEGLLAEWRVKPGQAYDAGDVLLVVETEKIANEIEAQSAGVMGEILVGEGETVPVGTVIATLGEGSESRSASPAPPPAQLAAPAAPPPAPRPAGGRIVATPLARRIARQRGVDLASVAGSGPHGRIKRVDVEAALARGASPAANTNRRPATSVEQVVARRLTQAKQTIPHFYVLAEADVTELLTLREGLNASCGPRISITPFIIAAVGRALFAQPQVNALWDEGEIVTLPTTDVGMAVDSPRGLMVPVVRAAGEGTLEEVAARCSDLVVRARAGKLASGETEGGAISVSNIGMFGASHLVPIINPGQSAILGVAAIKPVFRPDANGQPALRREVGLVLSCDHRVLDGVRAARLLDETVRILENPISLLRPASIVRRPP